MTTPNQPDITIGSRWRLSREEQPPDYVGIVSEINWRLREAHVHPEDRRGADAWVSFDVLTQPAPLEVEVERQAGAAPADAAARDDLARLEAAVDHVQKIVTIDWGSAPKPRAVITLVDGQRIALTHEETAAFRWYLER